MNWKKIIVHCSATPNGDARFTVDDYRKWHKAKGWRDVGYNYVVETDGTLSKGRSEDGSGAHTQGQNSVALGICQTGTDKFSSAQFKTLRTQIRAWMEKYSIPLTEIYGHYQFAPKTCPGFKIEAFRHYIQTDDLSVMSDHLLDPKEIKQPGEDMGGEEEAELVRNYIIDIQNALNYFGAELKVDGKLGPKTKAAMIKIATQ